MKVWLASVAAALLFSATVWCASMEKPHPHKGVLKAYDGRQLEYRVTREEQAVLDREKPVTSIDRTGDSGRGFVLQDVQAPPHVCMDKIRDLLNYKNVVPKVKNIDILEEIAMDNGTVRTHAHFQVGIPFFSLAFFVQLTHEPKYNTFTWTLDYRYQSDFDDNTGHWQVMPHPSKSGWSRILYSTELKVMPWVPEFVVSMLTKTGLLESTAWVKTESEKASRNGLIEALWSKEYQPDLSACYRTDDEGTLYYSPDCANGVAPVPPPISKHSEL